MKVGSHACMGSRMGFVSLGQGCFQVERSESVVGTINCLVLAELGKSC